MTVLSLAGNLLACLLACLKLETKKKQAVTKSHQFLLAVSIGKLLNYGHVWISYNPNRLWATEMAI